MPLTEKQIDKMLKAIGGALIEVADNYNIAVIEAFTLAELHLSGTDIRGLADQVVVVTDGAVEAVRAAEEAEPKSQKKTKKDSRASVPAPSEAKDSESDARHNKSKSVFSP